MVDPKYKVRAAILYEYKLGKKATECHLNICAAFGQDSLSYQQICSWYKRFKDGDESLEDETHGNRPAAFDDQLLLDELDLDPTQTTRQLAAKIGCSNSTIDNHLEKLGKFYKSGRWTPHLLRDHDKANRVNLSSILLSKSKTSGFWDSILTSDETWLPYENVQLHGQWADRGQPGVPTPQPPIHGKKVMVCVWWNTRGVVHFEVLDQGDTVKARLYAEQLGRVDRALRKKRIDSSGIRFLHDNARPHVAKIVHKKIARLGWELLPHPPYSPDIAPSDYSLFRSMKQAVAGEHFKDRLEIEKWLAHWFSSRNKEDYDHGIRDLRRRWCEVIDHDGEYF